jgi:hypothetical protein
MTGIESEHTMTGKTIEANQIENQTTSTSQPGMIFACFFILFCSKVSTLVCFHYSNSSNGKSSIERFHKVGSRAQSI